MQEAKYDGSQLMIGQRHEGGAGGGAGGGGDHGLLIIRHGQVEEQYSNDGHDGLVVRQHGQEGHGEGIIVRHGQVRREVVFGGLVLTSGVAGVESRGHHGPGPALGPL